MHFGGLVAFFLAPVGCRNPAVTRIRAPRSLAQRPLWGSDLFALDAKNFRISGFADSAQFNYTTRWAVARTRSAIAVSGRGTLRANQPLTPCRVYRNQMTHHSMSVSARRLISTTRCTPVWPKVRSMTLHSRESVNKCGKRESRCQGRQIPGVRRAFTLRGRGL